MKILVVTVCFPPLWNWGGPVRSIWNLTRGLSRAGAEVSVVATDSDVDVSGEVPEERVEEGMRVRTLRNVRGLGRWGSRFAISPAAREAIVPRVAWCDVCILQGMWQWPILVASAECRRAGKPYVLCARGNFERQSLSEKPWRKRVYRQTLGRRLIPGASAILFASDAERDNSLDAIGAVRPLVSPNAVELEAPVDPDPERLRRDLGIPPDAPVIGMVGRIHPRKGLDVIVPALAAVDAHLVVWGPDEGGTRAGIEAQAADCGVADRLHFPGVLQGEALARAYASIDVLAMPSRHESFGNVVIEALAQGTPSVVSDRVPLGDYLSRHGLGAVLPLDTDAWAGWLARWQTDRPPLDRAAAFERVRADFGLEARGRELLDSLSGIVGERAADRGSERPVAVSRNG